MGRKEAPIASIIHLKGLMALYTAMKPGLARLELTDPSAYARKLKDCLINDGILKNSMNLVNKLLGKPLQHSVEDKCDGIAPSVLDKIVSKVFSHYENEMRFAKNVNVLDWLSFQENFFTAPSYLKHIQNKKYYTFLKPQEKADVDKFVYRKINELELKNDSLYNYAMYFWSDKVKGGIEVGILQINKEERLAIVKFLHVEDGKWNTKSVQRSDIANGHFQLSPVCYLQLIEEDSNKAQLRTTICLSVHGIDLFTLKYIKGTYCTADGNIAGLLMLEKMNSYQEVYKKATTETDPRIYFELIGENLVIRQDTISSHTDFQSNEIYEIIKRISGAYVYAFYRKNLPVNDLAEITRGICLIEENGRVTTLVSDSNSKTLGYVDNRVLYDKNIVCIRNFFKSGIDAYKYTYYLSIAKSQSKNRPLSYDLKGIYVGIDDLQPTVGKVVFKKINRQFKNFEDLQNAKIDYRNLSLKKLSDESLELRRILDEEIPYFVENPLIRKTEIGIEDIDKSELAYPNGKPEGKIEEKKEP